MTYIVILHILPRLRISSRIIFNFPDLLQYYMGDGVFRDPQILLRNI